MKFKYFSFVTLLLVIRNGIHCEDLPEPHLIIIGATGVGKSSLANVLMGESPDCDDCTFPVCPGGNSCTKQTKYAVSPWLGSGPEFTIVDTPGFGDSDNDDNDLINEMVDVLKEKVKTANGFVLLFNGESERFDSKAQQMLREFEALFGEGFWDHVVMGVSHWAYDQTNQNKRNNTHKTETWWIDEMNAQLHEKFHLEKNLEAVFIDSWAKQEWNLNDPLQQEAFNRETEKLWTIFSNFPTFEFKTIQDVLEENRRLKEENKWLNDVITNNISEIIEQLSQQTDDIEDLRKKDVNFNVSLGTMFDKHADDFLNVEGQIVAVKTEHSEDIASVTNDIVAVRSEHTDDIDSVMSAIDNMNNNMNLDPVGTIMAWTPFPDRNNQDPVPLPDCFVLCDGSPITKGIWTGHTSPDLNKSKRFLRGAIIADALNFEEDSIQSHTHSHTLNDPGHTHPYKDKYSCRRNYVNHDNTQYIDNCEEDRTTSSNKTGITLSVAGVSDARTSSETKPKNMNVVYIMKVC